MEDGIEPSKDGFDLEQTKNLDSFHKVFVNGWDYLLVSPQFLIDEDNRYLGIELLSQLDNSEIGDLIHFHLTVFTDFDVPNWTEAYSASSIMLSSNQQWQMAYTGMYFYPTKRNWCGIYLDIECQDVVILGAEKQVYDKIKATFPPSSILSVEHIKMLLERRYKKYHHSSD